MKIYLLADEYDAYANAYMNPHNPRSWSDSNAANLLKGFWSAVKASKEADYGIKKVYMTGVTPLLLSDLLIVLTSKNTSSSIIGFPLCVD